MNKQSEKKDKQIKKGDIVCMLLFFMLTVACIVFSILCIHASGVRFFQRNALWLSIVASSLLSLICGLSVVSIIAKKDQMKRDFLQRLRQLSHSAASAEAAFTTEEFLTQARQRVATEEPELPPEGEGDGDGDDGSRPE